MGKTIQQKEEYPIEMIIFKHAADGDSLAAIKSVKNLLSSQKSDLKRKVEGMKKIDNDGKVEFGDAHAYNEALDSVLEVLK